MIDARIRVPVSERGNALFISLVFLVILTTLGVSAAGTGRLELMMAANTQFRNQAYQAAESGIDAVLRIDTDTLINTPSPAARPFTFNPTTSAEQVNTVTNYLGEGECPGRNSSVGIGAASDSHIFTVVSTSQSQRGGRANHQQGFCIPNAASEL